MRRLLCRADLFARGIRCRIENLSRAGSRDRQQLCPSMCIALRPAESRADEGLLESGRARDRAADLPERRSDGDRRKGAHALDEGIQSRGIARQVDSIAEMLRVKPFPTVEAIMNTNETAAHEYGTAVENPLTLWDLHWLKELDDEGFINGLIERLS